MRRCFGGVTAWVLGGALVFGGCAGGTDPQDDDGFDGTPGGGTTADPGGAGTTATGGPAASSGRADAGDTASGGGSSTGSSGDAGESSSGNEFPTTGGDLSDAGGAPSSGGMAEAGADGGATPGGEAPDSAVEASDCSIPSPGATPLGYGQYATGGGSASPIVVSTFAEAESALATYRDQYKDGEANALVLHYDGRFDFSTLTDVCAQHSKDAQVLSIKEMENVTLLGLAGSSANFGIKINRAKNVVVRNMTMGLLPGGGSSDAITIEGNGSNGDVENVWIDHNDLFSSTKDDCPGAGDTEFDGLIDIKKGARYITISYNRLHDHQKTGLIGHSDSDDMDRYVTFHHNWYEHVVSRTPLHRFGYVHIFNNYYNEISSSGINVRMGGVALIEANYFENVVNPVTSRYSDEAGYWDLRDNFVGPGVSWTSESDTLANAEDWQSTADFPDGELTYSATLDPARCVRAIVQATAGATL